MTRSILTRRNVLVAGATTLAMPYVWSRPARAAGQVIVRNPGGAYDDCQRRNVYDPFTKETGIEVVIVPSTMTKMLAMVKSGNAELDVADTGLDGAVTLDKTGALAPIDYASWKYTDQKDLAGEYLTPNTAGLYTYSTVMAYNKEAYPEGKQPKSWAEFWDVQKFPGARMLADMASGQPNLEFALIADGVPMDKVYPIDVDRAFKSLSKIKPSIKKFWDTGALSAQMLADKDVVLGSIWNGRLQAIADKGAPVAIEWNQHMLQIQALGVFKDAKNKKEAQLFVDYSLSPKAQVGLAKELVYGPTNRKSFDLLAADLVAKLPGSPAQMKRCFLQDVEWWDKNRAKINTVWSKWILT
ncbi:MAG TPA: ABC transporter substrate-binding protein [Stellaceae bacterium]|nr:ABC transporter substrate-binding protein [Stellaceae bacterium]